MLVVLLFSNLALSVMIPSDPRLLVCNDIENLVFMIIDDFLDTFYVELFIDIDLFISCKIGVDSIILRSCDHNVLVVIILEKFWLSHKCLFESIYAFNLLCHEVQLKYFGLLHKNDGVSLSPIN